MTLAANQGHHQAEDHLCYLYRIGKGVHQDYVQAFYWGIRTARAGIAFSQMIVGWLYENGAGVEQNYKEAAYWYILAANQGEADAENRLGLLYRYGHGVRKDYVEAVKWLRRSESRGNSWGQVNLGRMYEQGLVVKQDYSETVRLYQLSSSQGNPYAYYHLGRMYENGLGITQNNNTALYFYRKAADQGLPEAQTHLRRLMEKMTPAPQPAAPTPQELYEKGSQHFDAEQYSEALKYYFPAVSQNYAPAQDRLGYMYQNGWGVPKNYTEARKLYQQAADQNYHQSQASLGFMYYKGWGGKKDLQQALYCYKKAADNGNLTAKKQYDKIQREAARQQHTSYHGNVPESATITGNNVNLRSSPSVNSYSNNRLNSGQHVSVHKISSESGWDWFYVKTSTGTEGWVFSEYLSINSRQLSEQEASNRIRTLPSRGHVYSQGSLNVRDMPSLENSQVVETLDPETPLTAYEIFAEEERDWYRVRTDSGIAGWVSGKYIQLGN